MSGTRGRRVASCIFQHRLIVSAFGAAGRPTIVKQIKMMRNFKWQAFIIKFLLHYRRFMAIGRAQAVMTGGDFAVASSLRF